MLGSVGSCTDGKLRAGSVGSSASWFLFCDLCGGDKSRAPHSHLTLYTFAETPPRSKCPACASDVQPTSHHARFAQESAAAMCSRSSCQEIVKVLIPICHHVVVSIPEDFKVEVKLRSIAGSVYNHFRLMK